MALAPWPAWPHQQIWNFCLPYFSKLFESWRLLLDTIIVHDKIEMSIAPVFVPVRFFSSIWHLKKRTGIESGTMDSRFLMMN